MLQKNGGKKIDDGLTNYAIFLKNYAENGYMFFFLQKLTLWQL